MNNNYPSRNFGKAAILLLTLGACKVSAAVTQQSDQVAIQLGAIQLGYTLPVTALTSQQQANALQQGRLALGATITTYSKTVFVAGASCPNPQSAGFRSELYSATMNALTTPVSNTITSLKVTNSAGTATTVTATLNPTLTTPDLVQSVSTALVPNYGPAFVSNAVVASMAYTTNSNGIVLPVYGPQPSAANINKYATNSYALNKTTSAAQLATAGVAASAAMTAALKNYATGTVNWQAYPTSGTPTNSSYLPNFGSTTVNSGSNAYLPNQVGLADAAEAVAAAAINGLRANGGVNTNSYLVNAGLYGITSTNVMSLAQSLTKAAATYQAASTKPLTANGNQFYSSGTLGADAMGLITQLAGNQNNNWGGQASGGLSSILYSMVNGMVKAVGTTSTANIDALVTGVSQGFYGTYLATCYGTSNAPTLANALTQFNASQAITQISTAFKNAGITSTTITSGFSNLIQAAFNSVNTAAFNNNASQNLLAPSAWNYSASPIVGMGFSTNSTPNQNKFGFLNGIGTPVTDTVGL